jgi:Na+-transporting methylmalonyl-CoA/oxaloacetate decarboxylase gamma subunit
MDSTALMTFKESLNVMVSGMGGIFVVMLIIFLLIKILLKVFPEKQ